MESHIRILAILHIVFASLGVLAAIIILLAMGGAAGIVGAAGQADGDADAVAMAPFLGGLGVIISGFVLLVSLPGLIGGIGLLQLAPWSRIVLLVVSALNLISFPFGTALGIYGFWVLTRPEAEAALRGNSSGAMASAIR